MCSEQGPSLGSWVAPCSDAAPRPLDVTHVPSSAAWALVAVQEPQRVVLQRVAPLGYAAE